MSRLAWRVSGSHWGTGALKSEGVPCLIDPARLRLRPASGGSGSCVRSGLNRGVVLSPAPIRYRDIQCAGLAERGDALAQSAQITIDRMAIQASRLGEL